MNDNEFNDYPDTLKYSLMIDELEQSRLSVGEWVLIGLVVLMGLSVSVLSVIGLYYLICGG